MHEIKLDGWRGQLHRVGAEVMLYTKGGRDVGRRFPALIAAARVLPTRDAILDGEIVALAADGRPDFHALHFDRAEFVAFVAFDLLRVRGRDLREWPLADRRARLEALLGRADTSAIRFSPAFEDPIALLEALESLGVEGIVSKRKAGPYRSGPRCGWIKIKTASWRAMNLERGELFKRDR